MFTTAIEFYLIISLLISLLFNLTTIFDMILTDIDNRNSTESEAKPWERSFYS